VLFDIVAFSRQPEDLQRLMIEQLWDVLNKQPLLRGRSNKLVNCTGDGALLVFPRTNRDATEEAAIKLALKVSERMSTGSGPAALRIALHRGKCRWIKLNGFNMPQAIGSGPNQSARLAGIGDGQQVIASEEFVKAWVDRSGIGVRLNFEPSGEKPFSSVVKHGELLQLRVLKTKDKVVPVPKRLAAAQVIDERIDEIVREINRELESLLESVSPDESITDRLDTRVSVFAPEADGMGRLAALVPTVFRYCRSSRGNASTATRYELLPKPEGSVGAAFVGKKPVHVARLPDPRKHLEKYTAELDKAWNIRREKSMNFSRQARSFISFPFGLSEDVPLGAVCIDMMVPLRLPKRDVEDLSEALYQQFSVSLGSLWALRSGSMTLEP